MYSGLLTLLLLLLLCVVHYVESSPFDPHVQPINSNRPFFEGWFTKLNDFQNNFSFAVIFGSFQPPKWHLASDFQFQQHWMSFLMFPADAQPFTAQIVFNDTESPVNVKRASDGAFISSDPDPAAPVDFVWNSSLHGTYVVRDNVTEMNFQFQQVKISFSALGRRPWSLENPNADGPEGFLRHASFLLPCHYAVHSLASPSTYEVEIGSGTYAQKYKGSGLSHMETNYGDIFPTAWTWAQGISRDGTTQILLTGGKFQIGPITPQTWVVAYRSERFEWNFRPTELDYVNADFDACSATLNLTAISLFKDKKLTMIVTIPNHSQKKSAFSDRLFFPTVDGFSDDPGCVESYLAVAEVRAYVLSKNSSFFNKEYELAECTLIDGAALEFGGAFMCKSGNP